MQNLWLIDLCVINTLGSIVDFVVVNVLEILVGQVFEVVELFEASNIHLTRISITKLTG